MKKLLLFFGLFIISISLQAQYTTGWDKAMNFGGAGADVEEMRYVGTDLYFFARMMGKYQFGGTTYDAGAVGSYPDQDLLFGKISASGTQTLLRRFESQELYAIGGGARIGADGSLYVLRTGLGFTQTIGSFTTPAYGIQLLKIDASGQPVAVKKLNTFSDIEFGTTGVAGPNLYAMQVKDNGDIYVILKSNTARGSVYAARVIKLDNAGNEVWNYEMTSAFAGTSTSGILVNNMPKQFVDDNGNVTFKVATTGTISFNGETLPYEEPYAYSSFGNIKNWIILLDNTGAKKWSTSAYVEPTFYGVNPQNGEIYINYQYSRQSPAIPASIAPFSALPNLAPPPALSYLPAVYSWSGIITLNTSGNIVKTKSNYANAIAYPTQMQIAANGRMLLYTATANGNEFKAGNNFITFTGPGYAAMEVDADFNPLTVFKLPAGTALALNNNKFAFGGTFKLPTTIGSTTLTPNNIDTDFNTRFPFWASSKTDVLIAEGNLDNIPTELVSTTWLGTSTNWNDAANWTNGIPTAETKVVFNATNTNMPSVATTPKAGQVVINTGVTASLPNDLVITDKITNNGVLAVNNALSIYSFTAYGAKALEGTGELFFNGTAAGAVTYASLGFPTTNTVSLNHNVQLSATIKDLKFIGTAAILTGTIEITNPDVHAISGFSATAHIRGALTRAINPTGVYVFPTDNFSPYEPTTITLNNLTGTTKITVKNDYNSTKPNLNFATGITDKKLGDYNWMIAPDVAPTSGTYDVSFQKSEFTNGVTDADRYVVLKRVANSSPWTFEGTKTASTQTGGTTSGSTVSNATVTAGLTGLSTFSDFTIGINSTPVTTGTTVVTSTWTGNTNTEWNNAGNWSNGIPNGITDATIPSGLTNYPTVYTATDNARSLTIDAGITGLKLHSGLILTKGLINKSDIEIARLVGSETKFLSYGGGISGSGKLVFKNTGFITSIIGGVINNNLDIDITNTNSINIVGKIGGNINIISGKINALDYSGAWLELTNPVATISINSNINHIAGRVYKTVNTTGTYKLHIGDEQWAGSGVRKCGEISITNNNISSPSIYNAWFTSTNTEGVSLVDGNDVYNSFINSGQWKIFPSAFSTTGTIDITLKTDNYTNGRVSISDYVLMRRVSTSGAKWVLVPNASISETAGVITATVNGIAPFSTNTEFCIGLKATTTTWTGTTSTDWNIASNWSNGIPTATVKAVIANAARYPNNAPTSGSAAAAIEIASGSTISLPSTFYTPNGIINNGTINISGSGTFFGFGGGSSFSTLSGTGKLVFDSASPTIFNSSSMNSTMNNSIEVNNPAGLALTTTTTFTGNVTLTNGVITVPDYTYFTMNNPNATITGTATGYIKGSLRRIVNATGTVNFPVGTTGIYAPASLVLTDLAGTTEITTSFSNTTIDGQPNLIIGNATVSNMLSTGSWKITPNTQPTAGSYAVTLNAPIGSSTATTFHVLKRTDNYSFYPWENQGTNVASTTTGGIITASATGITTFSQFGIGEGITTLPVKLVKFLASADAKSTKLYWETASELNNDKFEIEHSTNGTDFVKIGEVKGNETSQKLNIYSFRDLTPANGVNYYRLKQVDLDGNIAYSETKFANFDFEATALSVYPNPTTDVVNFSKAIKAVEIYNLQGVLLFQQSGEISSIKIPKSFNLGLYLLKLKLNNGSSISKQIIINR